MAAVGRNEGPGLFFPQKKKKPEDEISQLAQAIMPKDPRPILLAEDLDDLDEEKQKDAPKSTPMVTFQLPPPANPKQRSLSLGNLRIDWQSDGGEGDEETSDWALSPQTPSPQIPPIKGEHELD